MRMLLQPLPTGEVANPTADLTERDFPLSGSLRRQLSPRRAFELVLCLLLYFIVNTASNFFINASICPRARTLQAVKSRFYIRCKFYFCLPLEVAKRRKRE